MTLFFITVLAYAPLWLLLVMVMVLLVRWCSEKCPDWNWLWRFVALGCVLGLVYGLLRFNGVILFADDNFGSYHWFSSSYGDEGFGYIVMCGAMLVGIGLGSLLGRKNFKQ